MLIDYYGKETKDLMNGLKQEKAMIRHQANIDYYTSTIKFLNELQEKNEDTDIINQTLYVKNQILFKDKEIEILRSSFKIESNSQNFFNKRK